MPEGFSDSAKARGARGVIGTAGLEVRLHSGDPGANGTSSGLTVGTGGYQHRLIDNSAISISTAGVINFPGSELAFPNPTADWSAAPTWASVWTRDTSQVWLCNVDITDIARPGSANSVSIPVNGFTLIPIP